ncbi:hypothetical protein KI387_024355, partial [Taxus chinensis]
WLTKRNKKALYEALEKIIIRVDGSRVHFAIAHRGADTYCQDFAYQKACLTLCFPVRSRRLVLNTHQKRSIGSFCQEPCFTVRTHRGVFWATTTSSRCFDKGLVPLVSQSAMHQLHIFIFVLAIFQVLYSILTMGLGRAKMRRWKAWEKETDTIEYQFSHDPSRFRLAHETSFVRRHTHFWNKIPILIWIESFFRQFYNSVTKVDYLTLRHGFISAHMAPNSKFNFRKYISRSLEDDFKVVVGI